MTNKKHYSLYFWMAISICQNYLWFFFLYIYFDIFLNNLNNNLLSALKFYCFVPWCLNTKFMLDMGWLTWWWQGIKMVVLRMLQAYRAHSSLSGFITHGSMGSGPGSGQLTSAFQLLANGIACSSCWPIYNSIIDIVGVCTCLFLNVFMKVSLLSLVEPISLLEISPAAHFILNEKY